MFVLKNDTEGVRTEEMFSMPFPLHTPCMPVTLKLRYTISMISGAKASVKLSLRELAIFWCNTGLAVSFFSV